MSTGKRTFRARTFQTRTFASATWAGVNGTLETAASIDRETKWTAVRRPKVATARKRTSYAKAVDRGRVG